MKVSALEISSALFKFGSSSLLLTLLFLLSPPSSTDIIFADTQAWLLISINKRYTVKNFIILNGAIHHHWRINILITSHNTKYTLHYIIMIPKHIFLVNIYIMNIVYKEQEFSFYFFNIFL